MCILSNRNVTVDIKLRAGMSLGVQHYWPHCGVRACASDMTSNVRDFGAVGDGRTDDSEAFLKAAAAVNPGGGVLYIPAGAEQPVGAVTCAAGGALSRVLL